MTSGWTRNPCIAELPRHSLRPVNTTQVDKDVPTLQGDRDNLLENVETPCALAMTGARGTRARGTVASPRAGRRPPVGRASVGRFWLARRPRPRPACGRRRLRQGWGSAPSRRRPAPGRT